MSNIKNYLVLASTMLLISTVVVANSLQIRGAFAQNINTDQKIKEIETQFPLLSQNGSVQDVIHKVQGLDKDSALKTLAAYHILRNLQEFQALEAGQGVGIGGATNSTGK
ncbi:MAG TPA: hypothetical protein VGC75_01180 [Candidatus Nitrosocosmicus sp.]|jgi:hypothetical protein